MIIKIYLVIRIFASRERSFLKYYAPRYWCQTTWNNLNAKTTWNNLNAHNGETLILHLMSSFAGTEMIFIKSMKNIKNLEFYF